MQVETDWELYDRWNAAIAEELFSGRNGSRPVYIDLESETIRQIASRAGLDPSMDAAAELIKAVGPTIHLGGRERLFGAHLGRLAAWQIGDRTSPPPILALLGYLSLVAERMRTEGDLAASNYYGRFVSMLGGDPRDEDLKAKVFRAFADHSGTLWNALNDWLEERPEIRGLPTAFAFDHRSYVGPALSQALVRDSDRRALWSLFDEAGLQPGQRVAVDDMMRMLDGWLPGGPISAGLRRLSRDRGALARIAEVACIELAAWSGPPDEVDRHGAGRLALTASIRRLPRRGLRLGAAAMAPERVVALSPGPDCDAAGRAALGAAGGRLRLSEADADGWRTVSGSVGIADLLVSRLELLGEESFVVRRLPRPVVVLAREGTSDIYREVDRVRLTKEHMLLAVESSRSRLERELAIVARKGFEVHESLPGLPQGWLLYEGIEIVSISETKAPDLAVLVPVAWTEVTLEGGMRLPGRASWHSRAAPELKASAASGRTVDALLVEPGGETHALGCFEGTLILAMEDLELEDGEYRVELRDKDEDRTLSSVSMRLCSADAAPLGEVDRQLERRPADGPLWPISLEPVATATGGLEDDEEGGPGLSGEAGGEVGMAPTPTVEAPSCYLTGAHHIDLPPAGPGASRRQGATIEGSCRFCGLEKRFPTRPRRFRRAVDARAAIQSVVVPPRAEAPKLDYELLLDALSFIGQGRAERMSSLLSGFDVEPWTPTEALRTMSALGHLDVTLDRRLRPASWRCVPATIAVGSGEAHLTGFRSERLVYEIGNATELRFEPQHDAPSRIVLPELTREAAEGLVAGLRASVRVIEEPARSLATTLPSLPTLRASLPRLGRPPLKGGLERLEGNRWCPTERVTADGGYRTTRIPRTIWHRWGDDLRLAESRLVKWLSASPHDLMRIGPDGSVTCRRGAQPPWLYERALVQCSGLAPLPGPEHTVLYREIPSSVAEALLASMTGARGLAHA